MFKIIETVGLSGSGKSTWAKKMVQDNPGKYKRVNKDDLRAMLDVSKWSKSNEKFVKQVRDNIILEALKSGYSVIVDDTNLNKAHNERYKELAKQFAKETGKQCVVETNNSFLDISIETCIKQDLQRLNSVGEAVIRKQYDQYLKKEVKPMMQDKSLDQIYIFDIDGTIAKMKDRSPFEWHRVGEDDPIEHVIDTLIHLSKNYGVVFMSGRDEVCRNETEVWITRHTGIEKPTLFMRPQNDQRKDSIIKQELFDKYIKDKYYVVGVFDDRDQVVKVWRDMGLICFQCNYGNF